MNPEIETSLNTLREQPRDLKALQSLEEMLTRSASLPADDSAALYRSLQHHKERGNWEVALRLVDAQLPWVTDKSRRAELLAIKGHVLEDEMLDEVGALAAFQEALADRPEDEATRETVDHILLVRENWERVVAKYAEEAESSTDRQVATNLFLSAAEVAWRNDESSPLVEQYLRRSLEIDPRNRRASSHLERLLRRQKRLEELVRLLEQRADVSVTREERVAALIAEGDLWATELNNPDAAIARYRSAISLDPSDPWALRCLVETLTRQESWSALVRLYEDALRARPAVDQETGILLQIGVLYDRKLNQPEQAEEYFRRIRKLDPAQPVMLDFYRGYYRQRGEPSKILALLDGAARMGSDALERLALSKEMARVAEEEVGNLEKAIDIWKGIQRLMPASPEATFALKKLYRLTQPPKWNALRELLKDEIDRLGDESAEEKIELLLEVVEIYRDHLKLDVMVINTYNAILALRPDHAEALNALAEKYESMGRWNDLIGLLTKRKDVQRDAALKVATLHRVALLWIEKFGNQSQAIKPLEEILHINPTDEKALAALRDIHTRRRNWRELMALHRIEAAHRTGPERRAIYKEMAWLAAEKLGDAREGIQVWNSVLEQDPVDAEALSELAALYRREERWAALAEILHRQVEALSANPGESLKLLEALGDIYTNRLRAVGSAIEVWREVIALKPDSPKARAVLRELYVQEQRWDDLDQLFRGRGEFSELAETLTAAADRSADRELKTSLYAKVGRICSEHLGNPDRAIKAYERVMAIDPAHAEVARALVPLYRGSEKWARLLSTFEVLLKQASAPIEKLDLLEQIRRLCETQLGSKTLAFQWCAQAFALDPASAELRQELERLAAESEGWEELVQLYDSRLQDLPDESSKVSMLRHLAQLCIERLHRPEEAEVHYRRLLELQPDDLPSLEALEQIYTATLRWAELCEVYRKRAKLEGAVERRADFMFKIAYLQEERLGDPVAAINTLIDITTIQAESVRALKTLERLYQVRSEWIPLVEVYRRELELVEDRLERVEVLYRLAEVYRTRLSQMGEAVSLYAKVLELDPLHRPTVQALEAALPEAGHQRARVARLLQPFYERTEDWARLVRALGTLLESEEDPDARISLYKRTMSLQHRRLDNAAAAFEAGSHIMAIDPEDPELRREMLALADRLNRVDELATLLADALHRIPAGSAPSSEKSLSWELALILDERLGRPEEAEPHLRRVVAIDPGHRDAFDALERILRDTGKWTELREVLEQRKELAQAPAVRRDILIQISALNEDVLGDVPAAIRAYEELLAIEPDHTVSLRALERHYTAESRWEDLIGLLRREMDFAPDDAALNELKLRQAELLANQLSDAIGATDLLEEVVAMDPNLQPAVDLLERLMQLPELRLRVTEILEPVYQRRENWSELVRILLARRALIDDRFQAVELLCRAAVMYEEQLSDPASAFIVVREALLLEPGTPSIQESVERLASQLGSWTEAAETWQRAADAADPGDLGLRTALLMRLARVYDEKIGDPDPARVMYEQVIETDPANLATARPAADALARLYQNAGQWPQLIAVLRRQLEWTQESAGRQDLLLQICRIQEDMLGDVAATVSAYTEVLEENPGSGIALDALERLYIQTEQWENLIAIYRRRISQATAVEERRNHWLHIAGIYEEELSNTGEAVTAYLALLDEVPSDLDALRALARIYRKSERWPDLLEMIERQLQSGEEEARIRLLFEAATVEHRYLSRPAAAVDRYREILAREPGHQGARQGLEELLLEPDHKLTVAAILAPLYEADANWESLIRVHELQAEVVEGAARVLHLRRIASLCEDGVGDAARAFEVYRRAVQAAVAEPDLLDLIKELHRIARLEQRWNELVQTLEAIVADVLDSTTQQAIHQIAAGVCREELSDLERSRQHYQQILDANPDHRAALEALESIYESLARWEALLQVLTRLTELAPDDESRRQQLLRSAAVWRDKLSQPDEAIADYEQVLRMFPSDPESSESLDALYTATGRWVELAALINRAISSAEDRQEQVALHSRLGQLRAQHLDDPLGALESYQTVLSLDPTYAPAIAELESYLESSELRVEAARILEPIYVARQDWERLIHIYQIRLEAAEDPERRLMLSTRIAQLYEEQLEDLEGAFVWYGKVFLEKPSDDGIRDQLLRLAGILDRWVEVAAVFAQHLDRTLDENETTRSICIILGTIYDERLGQVDAAARCFQRALGGNRDDHEAFLLLESLYTRYDRWEELLRLYEEAVGGTLDAGERRELLLKICRVWEEALEKLPEAIDAYRAVLDLDQTDAAALQALDRLYTDTGRWQDLADLLSRQCEFAGSEAEVVALKYRLGTIHELRLEDLGSAIDLYEEVLRRDQSHAGAIAALERLILDREQRFRIAQVLEPIYRQQDEWAKLVVIYDAQLDFIEERERRGFLLREIARLHEDRDGSLELAFRALSRAFHEEPESGQLMAEVERLAGKLDNWNELTEVLRSAAESVYDFHLIARVYSRIADIQENRLNDRAAAVEAWKKVLASQEDNLEAIGSLIRLYEALGRHQELIEVLTRRAEITLDFEERKATCYRIAEIHELVLGVAEKAIETYRQVLVLDETEQRALDALDRLYLAGENWMELIWVYRRKIEIASDPEARRALQLAVAQVYEEGLADRFEAIAAYKLLLEETPTDRHVLESLDRLYTHESLFSDVLEVIEAMIREEQDPRQRNALIYRAATILEHEIGDLDAAIGRYRQVLEADTDHAEARAALERLVRGDSHREILVEILERLYLARSEIAPLVEVLELKLEALLDQSARRDLLLRIGRLREEGLGDPRGAFLVLGRALAEDPVSEQVQRELDRLAEQMQVMGNLVEVYEQRLAAIYDPMLARQFHLKVARLLEERLNDDDRAAAHYRTAMEQGGDDLEPLQALDRVLLRQGKWGELLEVLAREIQAISDGNQQGDLYYRMGEIQGRLGDADASFVSLREALERDSGHAGALAAMVDLLASEVHRVPALDVLEPICESSGQHGKLVELLEVRLTTLGDPHERSALLQRIAKHCEDHLGDPGRALEALGRAMSEDPADNAVLDGAERIGAQLGRFKELTALTEMLLGGKMSSEAARELGLRTARWYGEKLSDVTRSEQCLKRVLEVDPDCAPALQGLERIYRASANDLGLAQVLWRRGETEHDGESKRAILAEVALLREASIQDVPGAIEAWKAVMDTDPGNREAQDALARLYQATKEWPAYLDILEQQSGSADGNTSRIALKHRAGEVLTRELGELDRAVDVYRDILDLDPKDQGALAALESIHESRQDWRSLQEVLLRRLDVLSGRDRIPVLLRLAELCGAMLDRDEEAIGYYQQVLVEDPEHLETMTKLEAALREGSKWYDLVDLMSRRAELLARRGDQAAEVEILVQSARIWNDLLENPDTAAEILEKILQRDARNVTALAGLARIYESTKQWERCREVLERAAALNPEPREAAELAFRMGRVSLEQSGDETTAAVHFGRALELDPHHVEAAEAMESFSRKSKDWPRLALLLEHRAARLTTPADRLPILRELAALYLDLLNQPSQGVASLERAREISPEAVEVIVPLAEAYFVAGRVDDAGPLFQKLIDLAGRRRSKEVAHYTQRLGAIAEKRGDAAAAREYYDQAYKMDSTHGPTLIALGRIYVQLEDWQNVRKLYRSMLLQNMDERSGVSKAEVFLNLGLAHAALNEKPKAISMFERGLETAPDHQGLKDALARVKG